MKKNKKIYQSPVARVIMIDTSQNMLAISGGTSNGTVSTNDWTQEAEDGVITEN